MKEEIIISGFGGQGVLSMGKLLAYAGMMEGKEVTWLPAYGPEQRGGTANVTVIISDKKISSPILSSYSTAILLNQPSLERFTPHIRPGGTLLFDNYGIIAPPNRKDINIFRIDAMLFQPEANISTAVRYLNKLQHQFDDIRNPLERQKFTLAAYNGGYNHIRDAQRLAQKYHRDPQSWDAVSYYVYNLNNPHYYRDPVVRYGYMIGNETYHYVNNILDRYAGYQGVTSPISPHLYDLHTDPEKAFKKNRFTRHNTNVLSREDSIFKVSH